LRLLDGLPLALAQAASYLREERGLDIATYAQFYKQAWQELMKRKGEDGFPLLDDLEYVAWITWKIAFDAVKEKNEAAASLLRLWAFLDDRDLWHGLLRAATESQVHWPNWLKEMADNEPAFVDTIQLLQNYSMVESTKRLKSYGIHPAVYRLTLYLENDGRRGEFLQLAVKLVGWAVPDLKTEQDWVLQRRLLPHADHCSYWVLAELESFYFRERYFDKKSAVEMLVATHRLGNLYVHQGQLREAEQIYQLTLKGREEVLGPDHTSTLDTVHNIGGLYVLQGKMREAEDMFKRSLTGCETALGLDHTSTLQTANSLGSVYWKQGKLKEAEGMFQRALIGCKTGLGPDHPLTLQTVDNLAKLYTNQGQLKKAEEVYQHALTAFERALGPDHISTLQICDSLGRLYRDLVKLKEAEEMLQRALAGFETALGPDHMSALQICNALGNLHWDQGKTKEAEGMFQHALTGFEKAIGPDHALTIDALYNLGSLHRIQNRLVEAKDMLSRALRSFRVLLGPSHQKCEYISQLIRSLYHFQGNLEDSNPIKLIYTDI
jgi:tetratricopeptide (TPR) repeat protein